MNGITMGMAAKSYRRIIDANERPHVAIAGLTRRFGAIYEAIAPKGSDVELTYFCDIVESQRIKALEMCQQPA